MRSIVMVLGLVVALASVARAEDDVSTQARTLYERGMAHFQLAEYDDAIAKWQEGFRLKPVPEFLYNIGQAYRLSQRPDKAMQAYRAYLRMSPKAANKVEVERHIAALQKALDSSKQAANAPPTQPTPVKPEPTPAPTPPAPKPVATTPPPKPAVVAVAPKPSPPPPPPPKPKPAEPPPPSAVESPAAHAEAPASPAPARNELTAAAPSREKPLTKKPWFWGVVAGGAAVVVGAVVLGVVLGTKDNTKTLSELNF